MPTTPSRLTSRQHPLVRAFRAAAAEGGARDGVLLDGAHLIRDALAAGVPLRAVLVSTEFLSASADADRTVVEIARHSGAHVQEATAQVLDAASPVRAASGIVALADWTPSPLPSVFHPSPALVVGLVDVQDPGNVGAVVRSADALGATGVLALDRTARPGGWKVLRGAMGSTFRIPVAQADSGAAIRAARDAGLRIAATAVRGATALERVDFRSPLLVLVGNEGAGLPPPLAETADIGLSIPMRSDVESLNVAVTAALVLYEAARQRRDIPRS